MKISWPLYLSHFNRYWMLDIRYCIYPNTARIIIVLLNSNQSHLAKLFAARRYLWPEVPVKVMVIIMSHIHVMINDPFSHSWCCHYVDQIKFTISWLTPRFKVVYSTWAPPVESHSHVVLGRDPLSHLNLGKNSFMTFDYEAVTLSLVVILVQTRCFTMWCCASACICITIIYFNVV